MLVSAIGIKANTASAQDSPCKNLDMESVPAIMACLKADEKEFKHSLQHKFNVHEDCAGRQDLILKERVMATDPSLRHKINTSATGDDGMKRPSCETISKIMNEIHGTPAAWEKCMGYENATDKVGHMEACIVSHMHRRNKYPSEEAALSTIASTYDCARAQRAYKQALHDVHRTLNENEKGEVYKLPKGFKSVPCEQVNAILERAKEARIAHNKKLKEEKEQQYAAQIEARFGQIEKREEKLTEQEERRKRTAAAFAAMDRSYDFDNDPYFSGPKKDLEHVNSIEHPRDKLEEKYIRRALVKEIHKMVPENKEILNEYLGGEVIHTVGGIQGKSISSQQQKMQVNHGIRSVENSTCKVNEKKGTASCEYTVTVTSEATFPGAPSPGFARGAEFFAEYGQGDGLGAGGPRTFKMKNDFTHDGHQWNAVLNEDQKKSLLPNDVSLDVDWDTGIITIEKK